MTSNTFTFTRRLRRTLSALLLPVLMISAWSAPAQAAVPEDHVIAVELGTHKLIREAAGVKRLAVGDPAVADVSVINARELLITGKKLGLTSLLVWPKSGAKAVEYRIRVGAIQDPVKFAKADPELATASIERGASLEGKLPNLLAYRRAQTAAQPAADGKVADLSQVEGDFQVLTQVKIAEVNRTVAQRYGFSYLYNKIDHTYGLGAPGAVSGISVNADADSGVNVMQSIPLQNAFSLVFGDATKGLLSVLSVLEGKGLVRVLAEPSLTAMSGQTASFLAGGEFPVPVNQSGGGGGGGGGGSITVEYKEFGVRLSLTPTVLSRGRIALKVAPEVSDLDFTAGIQIGGVSVPALTVRRTETSVELGDGESFVLAGLVSNNLTANVNKVPWLGDIPILGAFFKSVSNQRTEKELVMIVTPHLVKPLAREAQLPALPGVKYDSYRPGFSGLMFEETGDFDTEAYGFSR